MAKSRKGRRMIAGAGLAFALLGTTEVSDPSAFGSDRTLDPIELNALAQSATVRVAGRSCGTTLTGSGFVVGSTLITNRHLVAGASQVKVDQPLAPVLVGVRRTADDLDLASLDPVGSIPLEFAPKDARVGEKVVFAGHALGGQTVVREGFVHLYTDGATYGVDGPVMLLDGISTVGFSGGPVLDHRGEVVGVLQGYEPNLRLTIAIPVSAVNAWLQRGTARSQGGTGAGDDAYTCQSTTAGAQRGF